MLKFWWSAGVGDMSGIIKITLFNETKQKILNNENRNERWLGAKVKHSTDKNRISIIIRA